MAFKNILQAEASRSINKHRKIASSFRDTQLFEIFQLSCSLLRTAVGNLKSMNFTDDSQVSRNCSDELFLFCCSEHVNAYDVTSNFVYIVQTKEFLIRCVIKEVLLDLIF